MSWNGTTYCGWCGASGHNRLGCPSRKEYASKNPDGCVARDIENEKRKRQRSVESRACSYCREPGHNRKTCKTLKSDHSNLLADVSHYRLTFLDRMKVLGLGLGSLVSVPHCPHPRGTVNVENPANITHMVTGVLWDNIDTLTRINASRDAAIETMGYTYYQKYGSYRTPLIRTVVAHAPTDYQPIHRWDTMLNVGAKSHLSANRRAEMFPEHFSFGIANSSLQKELCWTQKSNFHIISSYF